MLFIMCTKCLKNSFYFFCFIVISVLSAFIFPIFLFWASKLVSRTHLRKHCLPWHFGSQGLLDEKYIFWVTPLLSRICSQYLVFFQVCSTFYQLFLGFQKDWLCENSGFLLKRPHWNLLFCWDFPFKAFFCITSQGRKNRLFLKSWNFFVINWNFP